MKALFTRDSEVEDLFCDSHRRRKRGGGARGQAPNNFGGGGGNIPFGPPNNPPTFSFNVYV